MTTHGQKVRELATMSSKGSVPITLPLDVSEKSLDKSSEPQRVALETNSLRMYYGEYLIGCGRA